MLPSSIKTSRFKTKDLIPARRLSCLAFLAQHFIQRIG